MNHTSAGIKGSRLGTPLIVHTFPLTGADPTATDKRLCMLEASADRPIFYRVSAVIVTPQTATTATLSVGTTAGAPIENINAQDLKQAAGTNLTVAANPIKRIAVDTPLLARPAYTGSSLLTALAFINVEIWEINLNEPTVSGG